MPTCGLAVTESERSLPDINTRIRALMSSLGFDEGESFVVRMTGAMLSSVFCVAVLCALLHYTCYAVGPGACHDSGLMFSAQVLASV